MLGLNRNLRLLFLVDTLVALSMGIVSPIFPLFLQHLGATVFEVTLVLFAAGLASTLITFPVGVFSDRHGKRGVMLAGLALVSLSSLLYSRFSHWLSIIPLDVAFTSALQVLFMTRLSVIADNTESGTRATVYGTMNLVWPTGLILGPAVGGFLVDHYGWESSFYLAGLLALAGVVPTLMISESKRTDLQPEGEEGRGGSLNGRAVSLLLAVFFLLNLFGCIGRGIIDPLVPIYLSGDFHVDKTAVGLFFSVGSGVGILLSQVPIGRLADRHDRVRVMILSVATIPLYPILWPHVHSYALLAALYLLVNCLWSATWPTTSAYLMDLSPTSRRGFASSFRQSAVRLGFTLGYPLGGLLWESLGKAAPFYASGAFFALALATAVTLSRMGPPAEQKTGEADLPLP